MKAVLIDYQTREFYYCDEETKYLQNVKKAIQLQQNKNESRDANRKYRKNYLMPLLMMATFLKRRGVDVEYISFPQDKAIVENILKETDAVFFWAETHVYPKVAELIKTVKQKHNITTVLGGYHATGLPKQILQELEELDYVCIGECERALLDILMNTPVHEIRGIAYRQNGEIVIQDTCRPLKATEITEPDYSILHGNKKNYRYSLQTTIGCPYRCKYCVYGYYGGKLRTRSVKSIERELRQIKGIYGSKLDMHILDNILGYNADILEELVSLIKELKMEIGFSGDIRAEYLSNPNQIRTLSELGVKQLFFGFEDANKCCRENAGRFMDDESLIIALTNLKNHSNIKAECYWMMGLPGTTTECFDNNIRMAVKLIEDGLIESLCTDTIFVPRPGSPLFDKSVDYGIQIVDTNWEHYQRSNYFPVYELDTISRQEIRDGLVRFDRAVIDAQLGVLGMSEDAVYEEYIIWANSNGVLL